MAIAHTTEHRPRQIALREQAQCIPVGHALDCELGDLVAGMTVCDCKDEAVLRPVASNRILIVLPTLPGLAFSARRNRQRSEVLLEARTREVGKALSIAQGASP